MTLCLLRLNSDFVRAKTVLFQKPLPKWQCFYYDLPSAQPNRNCSFLQETPLQLIWGSTESDAPYTIRHQDNLAGFPGLPVTLTTGYRGFP